MPNHWGGLNFHGFQVWLGAGLVLKYVTRRTKAWPLAALFAISASNLRRASSWLKQNFFSSKTCRFLSITSSAFSSASLAISFILAASKEEVRLPREHAQDPRFKCFEVPECLCKPTQLTESSGFTWELSWSPAASTLCPTVMIQSFTQ